MGRALVIALAACVSIGCRDVSTHTHAGDFARTSDQGQTSFEDWDPYADRYGRENHSREWAAVGVALVDRRQETNDLDDALGFTLDGGFDLTRTDLRPSIEIGGTYSSHALAADPGRVDLYRVSMGARLSWFGGINLRPYVRGGVFYRWNYQSASDFVQVDENGSGWYLGAGLQFTYASGAAFGPFYVIYTGDDRDRLAESFVGIGATFRL